ncbi:MAG: hypothetical protein KAI63_08700 [Planctomycetes bacterium]|nr:hypothetical protein [Planctomycetota bacterium]
MNFLSGTQKMLREIHHRFLPNKVVILHPAGPAGTAIRKISPFIEYQTMLDDQPTAYICIDFACQQPTTEIH